MSCISLNIELARKKVKAEVKLPYMSRFYDNRVRQTGHISLKQGFVSQYTCVGVKERC